MLFQVLCGFEPIFYITHPNEEPIKVIKKMKRERVYNRYKRRDNYEY